MLSWGDFWPLSVFLQDSWHINKVIRENVNAISPYTVKNRIYFDFLILLNKGNFFNLLMLKLLSLKYTCSSFRQALNNKTEPLDTTSAWLSDSYLALGILGFFLFVLLGITSLPSVSNNVNWREFRFVQVRRPPLKKPSSKKTFFPYKQCPRVGLLETYGFPPLVSPNVISALSTTTQWKKHLHGHIAVKTHNCSDSCLWYNWDYCIYKRKLGRCELLNEKQKADFDIKFHNCTKSQNNLAIYWANFFWFTR